MAPRKPTTAQRTVVCFVRHGTTPTTGKVLPGRTKGLHLSEQGLAEATRAGERLAALNSITAIYSSPLERAKETAGAISRQAKLPVRTERGLLECDFGQWTGAELAALRKLPEWQTVLQHPSGFRFPEGESFGELRQRIVSTIDRLVEHHAGEVIVVVSHADPIKIAIGEAMGVPLDLMQRTVISPASISVVAYSASAPVVLAVNSGTELAGLGLNTPQEKSKDNKVTKK